MGSLATRRSFVGACLAVGATLFVGVAAGGAETRPGMPGSAVLRGIVTHAPSNGVALFIEDARQDTTADSAGVFSFSVALQGPTYAKVEFDFRKGPKSRLGVFLVPGQELTLHCDASDIFATARFSGAVAAENDLLALLQVRYDRFDYDKLARSNQEGFGRLLRRYQDELEKVLTDFVATHPGLLSTFLRFERARITSFGALLRVRRWGLSGDWPEYAARLNLDDASLLPVDTYRRLLSLYTAAKGAERANAPDPAMQMSINRATEARYAVAVETYKSPAVRNAQLYEILRNQLVETDNGDGPFGCKGLEEVMARFDRDCTDEPRREDIDRRYRECVANRNAPVIRPYKTVGTTSLDAHIFPAAGAQSGDRRPAYLFFHGGGWAAGMPEWGYAACRRYAAKGLVGLSFEYRLRWRHGTTPLESVADAKSAVRWTRLHAAELGIDPDRIVVAGFSAGGHLAAVTGILQGQDEGNEDTSISVVPAALVLMSAAVDVAHSGWVRESLSGRAEPAVISPAQQVRSGLPPAIVFHGTDDRMCPFSKTDAFCQRMRAPGNRCDLHAFEGGHFRNRNEWAVIDQRTDEFLQSLGLLPDQKR